MDTIQRPIVYYRKLNGLGAVGPQSWKNPRGTCVFFEKNLPFWKWWEIGQKFFRQRVEDKILRKSHSVHVRSISNIKGDTAPQTKFFDVFGQICGSVAATLEWIETKFLRQIKGAYGGL